MSAPSTTDLQNKTQQLLEGPLKHIKAAALAAALLPLASVAAKPAEAQSVCASGGVCGTVFEDTNNNGIQDGTETGIEGVKIFVCQVCDGSDTLETESGLGGVYSIDVPNASTTISALIPTGAQASPPNVGDDAWDSDGVPDGGGLSVVNLTKADGTATNFGFFKPPIEQPGTGTPGYWKNHPEAWPVDKITVGGVEYTRAQAITWLGKVGKDKSTTLFSSLVSAMLNRLVGNDVSCVNATIGYADQWMKTYGPVGSNISGSSQAWAIGEPYHIILDNYNNGRLCAPHRN